MQNLQGTAKRLRGHKGSILALDALVSASLR